jgi:hypothetical protein
MIRKKSQPDGELQPCAASSAWVESLNPSFLIGGCKRLSTQAVTVQTVRPVDSVDTVVTFVSDFRAGAI